MCVHGDTKESEREGGGQKIPREDLPDSPGRRLGQAALQRGGAGVK